MALDRANPAHAALIQFMVDDPDTQAQLVDTTRRNMHSLDEFGILCLTEQPDADQMWQEYADNGRGFVVGFSTTHAGFELLRVPGRIGRVAYSDVSFSTFLGVIETEATRTFFHKRMRYAFEREWRSIRALYRLERHPGDVYLSRFDPASVREIVIRPTCAVSAELHQIAAIDARYLHLRITEQDYK